MSAQLQALDEALAAAGIPPEALDERFVRSRGPGGQHVNKSETAVQLLYRAGGIEVRAESERSQLQNRIAARKQLLALVSARRAAEEAARIAARERRRRQCRGRPPGVKRQMVEAKRVRGKVKRLRGRIDPAD